MTNHTTWGCTGFDGLTEDGEAVRGREPRKKLELNLNAEDNLALAASLQLIGPCAPPQGSPVSTSGTLCCQSFAVMENL